MSPEALNAAITAVGVQLDVARSEERAARDNLEAAEELSARADAGLAAAMQRVVALVEAYGDLAAQLEDEAPEETSVLPVDADWVEVSE